MNNRMIRSKEAPSLAHAALPAEQQLSLLHEEAMRCLATLSRWRWAQGLPLVAGLAFLLGYGLVGALLGGLALGVLVHTQPERSQWHQTQRQLRMLATKVRGTDAVGALLDFARWQGREAQECYQALERLLPRLDRSSAQHLTKDQRAHLRACAENQDPTVELTVAALLVLGDAGDRATIPTARKLAAQSSSQRIRDAAQLCLEALYAQEPKK
jgi:hypothetical protein